LPLKIVFGVFACALVVFGAIHALTFFGVYFLDPVADVNHVSLTAGQPRQFSCGGEEVRWKSDNPRVSVDEKGVVLAHEALFYPDSQARITGVSIEDGSEACSHQVTVVPWVVNHSSIEILDIMPSYSALGVTFYPPHSFKKTEIVSNLVQSAIPPIRILATEGNKILLRSG
jgi:hypothetical protein